MPQQRFGFFKVIAQAPAAYWLFFMAITMGIAPQAWAQSQGADMPPYAEALMDALGGVALLLFGLERLSQSLKAMAGDKLRYVLTTLTHTRIRSVLSGAGLTLLVQSSAATIAMLLGFVASGFMPLSRALGVVLGADIGTTLTVQLIAFRLNRYALFAVALGFFVGLIARNRKVQEFGHALMSVGLIFYGIHLISSAAELMQQSALIIDTLTHLTSPFIGLLVGLLMAALMQSSAAAMGVVVALTAGGILKLEAAFALTLGANIGTCITALIACSGKPRTAWRVAAAHVLFKTSAVAVMFPLVSFMPLVMGWLLNGMAPAHQVAMFHTLFNILIAAVFLPFTPKIAELLLRYIGEKVDLYEHMKPKYLDKDLLPTPSLAFDAAQKEIGRMAGKVGRMMERARPFVLTGAQIDLARIASREQDIDALYRPIMSYLGDLSQQPIDEKQTAKMLSFMACTNHMETLGDLIGIGLTRLGEKRLNKNVTVSPQTQKVLLKLYDEVFTALEATIQGFREGNAEKARLCINLKTTINATITEAHKHQATRLIAKEDNRLNTYGVEVDIIETLQRIYFHARKAAYEVVNLYDEPHDTKQESLFSRG